MPVQRPIPVWSGAGSPPACRRARRLGDGWFPQVRSGPELDAARAIVEEAALHAEGRDPAALGMEGRAGCPMATPAWISSGSSGATVPEA